MDTETMVRELAVSFGRLLKDIREREDLSRPQLAEKLDMSDGRIKQFETNSDLVGGSGFNVNQLVKVAELLDRPVSDVFKEICEKASLSESESPLVSGVKELPKDVAAGLTQARKSEHEVFGNLFQWALKMAALSLESSEEGKTNLEISLLKAKKDKTDKEKKRLKLLLSHLIDLD